MAFSFQDNDLFEINMALQCRVKDQKRIIDEFKSGKRYLKLQKDYHKVVAGYIKENRKLKNEVAAAHAGIVTTRNMWMDECDEVWSESVKERARLEARIRELEERNWELERKYDEDMALQKLEYEDKLHEQSCVIDELKNRLAHAEALLDRDSTNTSIPTGQTPIGKKKHIPNSRRSSGKPKGGQVGHKKHILENPSPEEITGEVDHEVQRGEVCPKCGSGELVYTGDYEEKYEIDVEVKVNKTLHKYWIYECSGCGELVRTGIAPGHLGSCQYGANVQATALSLMNTCNVPMNKVVAYLEGMTLGEISPCEGYIAKLNSRAARNLRPFMKDMYKKVVCLPLLHWDDTVIMIDKSRACLRFYGDGKTAYYVAHEKKDMDGIIEDGILEALTPETKVVHDHNCINYNERFRFQNIECNAHVERDLQKTADETGHEEPKEIKNLISATIKDRNDMVEKGCSGFDEKYIVDFELRLSELLSKAWAKASENTSIYSGDFERSVIKRIIDYRDNFFAWVRDFSIPPTNNLAERGLRPAKSKQKISGQFASTETANNYAIIKTYTETCKRNGINEYEALRRLCAGNPYTVDEVYSAE